MLTGSRGRDIVRAGEINIEHYHMRECPDPEVELVFELVDWSDETWKYTRDQRTSRQKAAGRKVIDARNKEVDKFWESIDREAGRID
jgi:hypothetical protein